MRPGGQEQPDSVINFPGGGGMARSERHGNMWKVLPGCATAAEPAQTDASGPPWHSHKAAPPPHHTHSPSPPPSQSFIERRVQHIMAGWPLNQQQILIAIEVEAAKRLKTQVGRHGLGDTEHAQPPHLCPAILSQSPLLLSLSTVWNMGGGHRRRRASHHVRNRPVFGSHTHHTVRALDRWVWGRWGGDEGGGGATPTPETYLSTPCSTHLCVSVSRHLRSGRRASTSPTRRWT